ncbi:MAG: sulfatase-like hydrolase/transferase [Planctomycetota bacterium]
MIRSVLQIFYPLALFFVSLCASAAPPNVILILTDDLGWGDLSVFKHPYIQTPNLDRMAAGGTVFNQFYVASPVCSPSRAAFQTGQFPARQSIHTAFGPKMVRDKVMPAFLDPYLGQISHSVKKNGYTTAHYGKWHLSGAPKSYDNEVPNPSHYGFDDFKTYHTYFQDVEREHHFVRGGDIHYRAKSSQNIINEVLIFMEKNQGTPVYINAWTLVPHATLNPTPEQLAVYDHIEPDPGDFPSYMKEYLESIPQEELKARMQIYCAAVSALDAAIGHLLDGIKTMGEEENTLIFFTSDNGPEDVYSQRVKGGVGSPGSFRGRKRSIYEGGVRTAAIAYWPGTIPAGNVNDVSVIAAVDWFPTICALTGSSNDESEFDGEDISDILMGSTRQRTRPLFWEWRFGVRGPDSYSPPQLSIRDGDWKLFMNPDGSRLELYNIPRDPQERLSVESKYPDVVKEMSKALLEWKKSLPDQVSDSSYVHEHDAKPYSHEKR